jgi:transaldolase
MFCLGSDEGEMMKFFLDTANIDEIKKATSWGIIDGVTTNPTLVTKEKKDFRDLIEEILKLVDGPVSVEAVSPDAEGMVREAVSFSQWSENVVVKIPMTPEGIKAVKLLTAKGIKTNVTLVFSANHALLAAKAGATYVSPFIGRLDDIGSEGMQVVREILEIYRNYAFTTEVIVASIRHPLHVTEAALCGADVATIPFAVLEKLFLHPLTDKGLEIFNRDWERASQKK